MLIIELSKNYFQLTGYLIDKEHLENNQNERNEGYIVTIPVFASNQIDIIENLRNFEDRRIISSSRFSLIYLFSPSCLLEFFNTHLGE